MARFPCHQCRAVAWESERGCLLYALVVVFFPLGLLLLLLPHRWQCRSCGNSIVSNRNPGAPPSIGQVLCAVATILLFPASGALIYFALTSTDGLFARIRTDEQADAREAEAKGAAAAAQKRSRSVAAQAAELQRRQHLNH